MSWRPVFPSDLLVLLAIVASRSDGKKVLSLRLIDWFSVSSAFGTVTLSTNCSSTRQNIDWDNGAAPGASMHAYARYAMYMHMHAEFKQGFPFEAET